MQPRNLDGYSSSMIGWVRDKPLQSRSHTDFSIPTLPSALTRPSGPRGGGPYYSISSLPRGTVSTGIREEEDRYDVLSTLAIPGLHTARRALVNAHTIHTSALRPYTRVRAPASPDPGGLAVELLTPMDTPEAAVSAGAARHAPEHCRSAGRRRLPLQRAGG